MDERKLKLQNEMINNINNCIYYLKEASKNSSNSDSLIKRLQQSALNGIKSNNGKIISDSISKINKNATSRIESSIANMRSMKILAEQDALNIKKEIEAKGAE